MGRTERLPNFTSALSSLGDEIQKARGVFDRFRGRSEEARIEGKKVTIERIESFAPSQLIPILEWAYGPKDWQLSEESYWKEEKEKGRWNYRSPEQGAKRLLPEEVQRTYATLQTILQWSCDEETRKHLDPAPGVSTYNDKGEITASRIPNWRNQHEVDNAIADLARYYFNWGEAQKITSLLAKDQKGKLLGVATIRWKGDPYVEPNPRVASIERLIVDPALKRKGIGTTLVATAVEIAFHKRQYDDRKGGKIWAREVRAWIMSDELAGQWQNNFSFFRKLGFRIYKRAHWPEFAAGRDIQTNRDAIWLSILPKWFEDAKIKHNLTICDKIEIAP